MSPALIALIAVMIECGLAAEVRAAGSTVVHTLVAGEVSRLVVQQVAYSGGGEEGYGRNAIPVFDLQGCQMLCSSALSSG